MSTAQDWVQEDFPCTLTLSIPFPSARLASAAHGALSVDAELSPLVRRSFTLTTPPLPPPSQAQAQAQTQLQPSSHPQAHSLAAAAEEEGSILVVNYAATTNRMLRVAVNGFIESVGVVLGVMRDLDVDVLHEATKEGLEGVQGLDRGIAG